MKTNEKKFLDNDWYEYEAGREDLYFGKVIDDEYVNCRFRKSESEIACIEVEERYLTPNFIKELNDELEKLEVK